MTYKLNIFLTELRFPLKLTEIIFTIGIKTHENVPETILVSILSVIFNIFMLPSLASKLQQKQNTL